MVGGDLELRGFYGNIMSICRLGNHEVSMETTRFPKKYASSRAGAGLRFPIVVPRIFFCPQTPGYFWNRAHVHELV